mmetsp:Transcript_12374/g.15435  ORF Transcript_12374/g.15435 Transcript_12374/m.15435 type:complete len:190 (-) Transcript_12374:3164-3733(-)
MTQPDTEGKQRLIHSSLLQIPQPIRFLAAGALSQLIFLTGYTTSLHHLESQLSASSVYAIISLLYIPVGHAITCLFVFGWPNPYLRSLLSTVPIGLSTMALGTVSTGLFFSIGFDEKMDDFLINNFGALYWGDKEGEAHLDGRYSSIVVMIITSIWSYVATMAVMGEAPKNKDEEVELTKMKTRKTKKE